jgi:hypothetical protein
MMKDIAEKKEPVVDEKIEIGEPDVIWHMDMTPMRIAKGRITRADRLFPGSDSRTMELWSLSVAS